MIYNPIDTFYKSKIGAVRANDNVTFRVKGNFNSLSFVYYLDGNKNYKEVSMSKNENVFSVTLSFARGLYFYFFKIDEGKFIGLSGNYTGIICNKPNHFQLSVYDEDYTVPPHLSGGIIYQIFPDRFSRFNNNPSLPKYRFFHKDLNDLPVFLPSEDGEIYNNDFFGGDLLGIVSKLDYLKEFGVTIIYLNPIFKAYSNHRYDTADYYSIDELLGSVADFKFLISECHKRNIKLILDGVFNHTGDDSIYFNKYGNYNTVGAYQGKSSPYYEWYDFEEFPDKYNCWWGIKTLPTINKNSSYIDYIAGDNGVVAHYTKLGVDGWRLDVVDELPKDFVQKIRKTLKSINKDGILIGEVWEDATNKIAYDVRREYFLGKELDSVMNYPLKDAIIDYLRDNNVVSLYQVIASQIDHYPSFALNSLMNMLSTHDTIRILTALSNKDAQGLDKEQLSKIKISSEEFHSVFEKLKIATILQFTLYGTPSIYYGDEIGMEGYKDPLNRAFFKWDEVGNEIYLWYKKLIKIRNLIPVFKDGETLIKHANNGLLIYNRRNENFEVMVVINSGDNEHEITYNGKLMNLIDGKYYENNLKVKGMFYGIFVNID